MTTGLDCSFVETPSGSHYYSLEIGGDPDDDDGYFTGDYVTYGPFPDFDAAKRHLKDNHCNPGGYSVCRLDEEPTSDMARTLSEAVAPVARNRHAW